ncbi:hypothetical protein SAY86_026271 [Trapa natans]|uniref:B box-type domain-containing protein n=1 Tax=Trapa natans TaxID=22666 RepID=A0AAN7QED2_TRANT|nr:hypothetical protein SAY86_026271 [Trapa natans]
MTMGEGAAGGPQGAGRSSGRRRAPGWLERVMGPERGFFEGCGDHSDRRKNEKNIFCLRCCISLCPHCLPAHPSHPLLQVRRYVYHDVIRLGDLEKLIDCSYIQPYTINGAKVIFLNERPQTSRSFKGSANICLNCDRILQEPFHFCSLQCKVDHLVYQGDDLSDVLRMFDESDFSISQFEGLRMDGSDQFGDEVETETQHQLLTTSTMYTTNSIILEEDPVSFEYGNNKGSSSDHHHATLSFRSSTSELGGRKNKKKGSGGGTQATTSQGSRRKGAPQRAPFS